MTDDDLVSGLYFFFSFSPHSRHIILSVSFGLYLELFGRTPNQSEKINSTRFSFFFFGLVSSESGWALLSTLRNLNGRYHADPAPI
jgi:hypothetical protein